MLPILPRQMLWTDKTTMEEFFELDSVNKDFYEVFENIMGMPFSIKEHAVFIFNEMYYQATRMVYERPLPKQIDSYIVDIGFNLRGNKYTIEVVMTMVYFLLSLSTNIGKPLNKFFTKEMEERFSDSVFWKPFKDFSKRLKQEKRNVIYTFQPCPLPATEFESLYVDWETITRDYDLGAIVQVLRLWSDDRDSGVIANLIQRCMESRYSTKISNDSSHQDYNQIIRVLQEAQLIRNKIEHGGMQISEWEQVQEMIDQIEKERTTLQGMLKDLQDNLGKETVSLSVLVEGLKDYTEEAGIDEAYELFRHLNNVLYDIPAWTKNIPELKKFFKNARKDLEKGITNIGQQNNFPNIGTYNAEVKNQNNNYPAMPFGQQGQKQLEE